MEWLSANHPEMFAEKFNNNSEMDSVPLSDLFGDASVASPVAVIDSEFIADNTRNILADKAGKKLSDKMGIDLAQGDPSDKEDKTQQMKMTMIQQTKSRILK